MAHAEGALGCRGERTRSPCSFCPLEAPRCLGKAGSFGKMEGFDEGRFLVWDWIALRMPIAEWSPLI